MMGVVDGRKVLICKGDEELFFCPQDGDLRIAFNDESWLRQHGYVSIGVLSAWINDVPRLDLECNDCPERVECHEDLEDVKNQSLECSHYDLEQTRDFLLAEWKKLSKEQREEALYGPNSFCE